MDHPKAVVTGFAEHDGVRLYYERRGRGEPLLFVSGGGGDAGFFTKLAEYLQDSYTVVTYDRRGYSRSTRPAVNCFSIHDQVGDLKAVLTANGYTSAHIVGNSAGAIIALEAARTMPEIGRTFILHEPPVVRVLPNASKHLRFFTRTYKIGLRFGSAAASNWFNLSLSLPFSVFQHIPKDFQQRMIQHRNNDQFIYVEMMPLVQYMPDYRKLAANGADIYLASGARTMAKKKYYGITSPLIAHALNRPFVLFPGHHLSFLEHAELWGEQLKKICSGRSLR